MKALVLPRSRDIIFLSIFIAAILLGPRMLNTDGDLPHYLAVGKYVLQGHFPAIIDIFSYTRNGVSIAPHKWLSGVFFYIAFLVFDERGIVILSALLLATTFALIYSDGVKRTGTHIPVFILVVWGAAVSSLHWISRPHLFTMLLFAIWLILNERLASGRKVSIWYFVVLMFLWNNIHGEFIAGFLVTGATLAAWIWEYILDRPNADIKVGKRLGIVLASITFVTLVNPVSFRALSTVTSWLGNDYLMSHTNETIPPNFADPNFLILLSFLVFSIFLLVIKREKLPARMGIILAGFSAMVLLSARNVHFYGVVAPFVLVSVFSKQQVVSPLKRFEELLEKIEGQIRGIFWPALTVLVGIILLALTPLGSIEHFSPTYFPIQATEWLKSNPQKGNMFNTFDWGGYISFELFPKQLVFIDSQGDVYGEAFIREYEQVVNLEAGWQDILSKYNVNWALIPKGWDLATALEKAGWTKVYNDTTAVILVRGK
ncbi:MAG: hypothetical protein ABSG01_02565 [Anaerolineales bacterium]|jgi:hypothetical protein